MMVFPKKAGKDDLQIEDRRESKVSVQNVGTREDSASCLGEHNRQQQSSNDRIPSYPTLCEQRP